MSIPKMLIAVAGTAVAVVLAYDVYLLTEAYTARQVAARPGFTCRWLTDSTGHTSRYVVFVPHTPPPETGYPVLLFLNGFGENGDDGTRQLSRNLGLCVWEMKGRFPFVVVAPQCHDGGAWTEDGPDRQRAFETLEEVIQTHGCDRNRVFVTGPSSGGAGVLAVAAARPELFAGAVPLCAGSAGELSAAEIARIFAEARLPVWSLYNDGDAPGLVAFNRELQQQLLRAGLSPHWSEYARTGHNVWEAAYRNPALYHWMLQQDREKNRQAAGFELSTRDSSLSNSMRTERGAWEVDEAGVWNVDVQADSDRQATLLLDRVRTPFELHFDCRLEGTHLVALELTSADSAVDSVRIVIELPEQGGCGVFTAGRETCLAVADPVAQRALQSGRWNDIRLRVAEGRLHMEANGWTLLECDWTTTGPHQVRLQTTASGDVFRFLRLARGE